MFLVGVNLLREGLDLPEVALVLDSRCRQGRLSQKRDKFDPNGRTCGQT